MCNEQSTITKQMIINILQPKSMGNSWAIQWAITKPPILPILILTTTLLPITQKQKCAMSNQPLLNK